MNESGPDFSGPSLHRWRPAAVTIDNTAAKRRGGRFRYKLRPPTRIRYTIASAPWSSIQIPSAMRGRSRKSWNGIAPASRRRKKNCDAKRSGTGRRGRSGNANAALAIRTMMRKRVVGTWTFLPRSAPSKGPGTARDAAFAASNLNHAALRSSGLGGDRFGRAVRGRRLGSRRRSLKPLLGPAFPARHPHPPGTQPLTAQPQACGRNGLALPARRARNHLARRPSIAAVTAP